jgi:hypothetical protein
MKIANQAKQLATRYADLTHTEHPGQKAKTELAELKQTIGALVGDFSAFKAATPARRIEMLKHGFEAKVDEREFKALAKGYQGIGWDSDVSMVQDLKTETFVTDAAGHGATSALLDKFRAQPPEQRAEMLSGLYVFHESEPTKKVDVTLARFAAEAGPIGRPLYRELHLNGQSASRFAAWMDEYTKRFGKQDGIGDGPKKLGHAVLAAAPPYERSVGAEVRSGISDELNRRYPKTGA